MANIKSALKRIEVAKIRNERNKAKKTEIKTYIKKFEAALDAYKLEDAKNYLKLAEKKLRQASAANIIHKNNISRKIGQMTNKLNKKAI